MMLSLRPDRISPESSIILNRNLFYANTGWGGVFLAYSEAILNDNFVTDNTADYSGGLTLYGSNVTLSHNVINGNTATVRGGGLYILYSTGTLDGNIVTANAADDAGGGFYLGAGDIILTNNLVADNQANTAGSGMYIQSSSPRLLHTTISRNAGGDGSGIYVTDYYGNPPSVVTLTNTILVSHTVGVAVTAGNVATLEATLWANGTDWAGDGTVLTGTVNVWGDPAFVDPDAGDYHISPGSAAIDAGVDAGVTTDIDGEPRPMGAGYDIGADELFFGPQLEVVKLANPDPVQTGAPLTYTLRVTNTGTVSLTATITDALPPHVIPGGSFVWTPVPLLPGEGCTETIVVTVEMGYVGPLVNVVQASSEEGATGAYTNTVAVLDVPIAGLVAANDSPTTLGLSTTLTASVTAGTNVTYTWAFGDGNTGSGAAVSHTYPTVGIYTAVVTASNSGSQLTATTPVTITQSGFYVYLPLVLKNP